MVGERKTASLLITESLSWGEQGYSNNLNGRYHCEFDLKLSVLSCCFLQTITFYMQPEVYGKVSLFCLPNRLSFHIPPTNCSVLAVRDGEQNVSSEILMHAPSTRLFLSFLSFFLFLRGPPRGRQHVKYGSEDKGNYLLEREQWSSFAPTPKSDSECCNCLPLTLTVILLRSAVTEYFSVAFQKLSFSLSRRTGDASNVIESLGLTYFFSTPALCFTGGRAERVRKRQEKQQIGLFKISRHCSPSTRPLKCDLRSVCDLCKYIGCHSKPFILTLLKGPLIKAKHIRRFYTVSLAFLCWSKSMEIAAFFGVMF